jgi:hypothetical protein
MKKLLLFIPVGAMCFSACRKVNNLEELQTAFVVQTAKATAANFGGYKTYFISDTIRMKSDNPNDTLYTGADALALVNTVKQNMSKLGYTFVPRSAHPDLGIAMVGIKNLNITAIYGGWWGGGYWGGCYWGYCGYPPYYGYGYPVYYSITTATLIMDMLDLKNASVGHQTLDVLWTSVMSGGLGFTSNDVALGTDAINQSFTQSSYIHTP